MKKIDARGLACPLPVIQAKKAMQKELAIEIIVDNEIAMQNLNKLAEQLNYQYEMEQISQEEYRVWLTRENGMISKDDPKVGSTKGFVSSDDYIVVIDTLVMGQGSEELGVNLVKAFMYSLTEQESLPQQVIFYNEGVKSVVSDSELLPDLMTLTKEGVEVYSCGACLDYYHLKNDVVVGEVTNMYRIVEMMRSAQRIIKI